MRSTWLTVVPDSELNREINTSVRKYLKNSFITHLNCIERSTEIECSTSKRLIQELNEDIRWHPSVFLHFYELRISMESRLLHRIVSAVNQIEKHLENGLFIYSESIQISSIEQDNWEDSYIDHLRSYGEKNIRNESTEILSLTNSELSYQKKSVIEALKMIEQNDPEIYSEILEFVTHIKIFKGKVLRGDTSSRSFGSMWIRVPPAEDDQVGYWIEHIVHEVSHLRLEALFFHDKIVLNPMDENIFRAPIRDDPRPMRGIFHATFVLNRMVRMFHKLSFNGFDIRFRDRLQLCRLQYEIGLRTVFDERAKLTPVGLKVRDTFLNEKY